MLKDKSLTDFTAQLASCSAVPGGGGAAAMAGALGAALAAMAASLTAGKKKYAAVDADMRRIATEAGEISRRLTDAVDADAEAFEPLSRAYSIPAGTPERAEIMEVALRRAAETPMEILELCCRGIELSEELASKCSAVMLSDAGCSAALCRGAMYAAAMNVIVNTKSMSDRVFAEKLNRRVEELTGRYLPIAEKICEQVRGRLK